MSVECNPKCGGCKYRKCPLGGKYFTLKEEREFNLIEKGLKWKGDHWVASYPWINGPGCLPNNYNLAEKMFCSLERRIMKNVEYGKMYNEQIQDMVDRNVARKLSKEENETYSGPVHYLSHHEVLEPDSLSTPCRIVFNASTTFQGQCINDYWAKDPDLLYNLLEVFLRFRENRFAIIGDIKKMQHTIRITCLDQYTHRFLWREFKTNISPDIFAMTSASFGDRTARTIATVALGKAAEMGRKMALEVLERGTYVDGIID